MPIQRWMLGKDWIPVDSKFVRAIQFLEGEGDQGTLRIEYVKGAICKYDNFFSWAAMSFYQAASKGKHVHKYIYDLDYVLERPARGK